MKKSTAILVLDGPGSSSRCTWPGAKCAAPPIARVQYVYPERTVTFGACAIHANRHERRARIEEAAP